MELKPGLAFGLFMVKALCLALAEKGIFVTVVDFSEERESGRSNRWLSLSSWRHTINVNLTAQFKPNTSWPKKPGNNRINMGSASGLLSRCMSLVPIATRNCINVLCPEFVETELASKVDSKFIGLMGGYVSMEMVVRAKGMEYWPTPMEEAKYLLPSSKLKSRSSFWPVEYPNTQSFEKMLILARGSYFSGNKKDLGSLLPFDAGFEAVGIIAAVGDSVKNLKVGYPAALMTFGSYANSVMGSLKAHPSCAKTWHEVVAMLTSGLTASIALEKAAQMDSGKVVLVTAAAGGTGQFAVQLAKLAGNKVVATCGGKEKAMLLKDLGVDRVIDYRAEDIKTVLKEEFPKGVDIVYESVGGEMFDLCLNALAVHGRMVVIGMISQAGFFLVQYSHLWQPHLDKLFHLYSLGKLKVAIDPKKFLGLHSVADAVEYLHSGRSVGKVVVCIDPTFSQQVAKL
ncbi:Prostaglandin reductase-3 [Camellia lanceoleosa]|nr:Prostaglandin reductase-3 [Camellia lanceoleosa]